MTTDESPRMPADSHGAVDLSSHSALQGVPGAPQSVPGAPAASSAQGQQPEDDTVSTRLDLPLITDATDQTFDTVMQTSTVVPVVIVFWAPASLESRGAVEMMEAVARQFAGRFQLVRVDLSQGQGIAQAFQIQDLPSVAAVIGGRPVPIFRGQSTVEQVTPVINELLGVAAQMGVNAGIRVSEADTAPPVPEEHQPALAAEAAGDLEGALSAWDKVLEHHPHDQVALAQAARLRLALRGLSASGGEATPASQADSLFAAGEHAQAFTLLLDIIAHTTDAEEKDAARARLVDLFRIAGNTADVRQARQKLATLLMV